MTQTTETKTVAPRQTDLVDELRPGFIESIAEWLNRYANSPPWYHLKSTGWIGVSNRLANPQGRFRDDVAGSGDVLDRQADGGDA